MCDIPLDLRGHATGPDRQDRAEHLVVVDAHEQIQSLGDHLLHHDAVAFDPEPRHSAKRRRALTARRTPSIGAMPAACSTRYPSPRRGDIHTGISKVPVDRAISTASLDTATVLSP